jgi:hypothetical protein
VPKEAATVRSRLAVLITPRAAQIDDEKGCATTFSCVPQIELVTSIGTEAQAFNFY